MTYRKAQKQRRFLTEDRGGQEKKEVETDRNIALHGLVGVGLRNFRPDLSQRVDQRMHSAAESGPTLD